MNAPSAVRPSDLMRDGAEALLLAPSLQRRRLQSYLALIIGDIAAILAGFGFAGYLYTGWSGGSDALP